LAGHPGHIIFGKDFIEKKVNEDELWTYKNLDELGVKNFVPELYSTTESSVKIENLL
jgi:hypothetical protein